MSIVWNTYNPSTEAILNTYTTLSEEQLEVKLSQAVLINQAWKVQDLTKRIDGLLNFSKCLQENRKVAAQMMAIEMGKPILEGLSEVDKCVLACKYYAQHIHAFLNSEEVKLQKIDAWIVKRPLGIILAIMPWNFPIWQVIRCAIPALLVGNTVLLKPAPSVQGIAIWLEKMFLDSFKIPVLIQLQIDSDQTEKLIGDPRIQAITFTGSSKTGRKVAAIAGSHLKKCLLELGGSDPYLIFEDADLDLAVEACVKARFTNGGQSCISAKRFFIHRRRYDEFKERIRTRIKAIRVGLPLNEETEIGPMAEGRFRSLILQQLTQAVEMGVQVLEGGQIIDGPGFFMQPTLVEAFNLNNVLMNEEVFGPILPLMKVESDEQALEFANRTEYGLGAAIFSKNDEQAWLCAVEKLDCGMVSINGMFSSDPRIPFGGVKNSGFGRELGFYGLLEFVNLKTVCIN
jgi:succinate-semialdehyde dehydrogenase/glutarate-semialdehyde dehydrogenase